jgi:hypothetical protein
VRNTQGNEQHERDYVTSLLHCLNYVTSLVQCRNTKQYECIVLIHLIKRIWFKQNNGSVSVNTDKIR